MTSVGQSKNTDEERDPELSETSQQFRKLLIAQDEPIEEKPTAPSVGQDISYPFEPLAWSVSGVTLETLSEDFESSEVCLLDKQVTIKPLAKEEFMHRAEQMKEEELNLVDTNHDGVIDKSEFQRSCPVDSVFSVLDSDGDGNITFQEFIDHVMVIISEDFEALADHRGLVSNEEANQILHRSDNPVDVFPGQDSCGRVTEAGLLSEAASHLKSQFEAMDVDGSGCIQRSELQTYWHHILSEEFEQVDANHDGVIDEEELAALVERKFDTFDMNHDGVIDGDELTLNAANDLFSKHIEIVDPAGLLLKDLGHTPSTARKPTNDHKNSQ